MKINKAIIAIMREKKFTQKMMASAIGKPSANAVGSRLSSTNMTFDRAQEMLEVLGYEIVIQPVTAGQRKDGAYVIDGKDEES